MSSTFSVDDHVYFKYGTPNTQATGIIKRVLTDGSYSIKFDDKPPSCKAEIVVPKNNVTGICR